MTLWVPRAGSKLEGGVAHAFAFGLQCSDSSTRPPEPGTWTFQGRSAVPLPTTIGTTRQLAGRRDHRSAVGQSLDRLLATLRDKGYDGASLADLSAATGLAKSSLYHSFPGGKEEIALRVLEHLDAKLARALFEPLRSNRPPARKLAAMAG